MIQNCALLIFQRLEYVCKVIYEEHRQKVIQNGWIYYNEKSKLKRFGFSKASSEP